MNADDPEVLGLSPFIGDVLGTNLFVYCNNNSINRIDSTGYMSISQASKLVNPAAILALFMPLLYACYSRGMAAVGLHVTKIITPLVLKKLVETLVSRRGYRWWCRNCSFYSWNSFL